MVDENHGKSSRATILVGKILAYYFTIMIISIGTKNLLEIGYLLVSTHASSALSLACITLKSQQKMNLQNETRL